MPELESPSSTQRLKVVDQRAIAFLYAALKTAKLYVPGHPSFRDGANRLCAALGEVFNHRMEFTLRHTEGIFHVEDDLFVEESLRMLDLLRVLEDAEIARVLFLPGITVEEISQFLIYLIQAKAGTSSPQPFVSEHLRSYKHTKPHDFSPKDRNLGRIQEAGTLIEEWVGRTQSIFSRLLDDQSLPFNELLDPLEQLIDAVHRHPSLFSIAWVAQTSDSLHHLHAVRSAILAIYLGHQLNLDFASLKTLALAALLHDVGRELLPSEFSTGYRLQSEDTELLKSHCRDGASYLSGVAGVPLSVIRVALEHHLGYDGKGYPQLPSSHRPHIYSQILAICDFLSWATVSEQFYHRPVALHKLIRCLIRRSGTQFNPLLVKLVVPFFGLYPPGTRLRLSTNEYAVSLEPNVRNVTRPALGCINPEGGMEFRWISHVGNLIGESFGTSIRHTQGYDSNIKSILPLIPNLFETDT